MHPSLQPRARLARLLALSVVLAAFAASAMAGSASAAQPAYTIFLDLTPTGSSAAAWLNASSSPSSLIELIRGGQVIRSAASTSGYASVDYAGALVAGDVIRFTTGGASTQVTFDGMPTIDSGACAGSRTVTGAVSPGATSLYVNSAMGSGSAGSNPATFSRSGSSYTATFNAPLAAGATVHTSTDQPANNGDTSFSVTRELPVAASCPASGATGGGASTPIDTNQTVSKPVDVAAQIVSALNAALGRQRTLLRNANPIKIAKAGFVNIPFEFVEPGSVTFTWQAGLPGGKAAMAARAKAKRTVIARGTARSATARTGSARVKLTAAGRRLLRTAKAVQITLNARFVPASGGAVQQSTATVTLRRPAKGARH